MQAPTAKPFDHRLSLHLDRLIIALESSPSWSGRAWLRLRKRLAERHVPAYGKAGAR